MATKLQIDNSGPRSPKTPSPELPGEKIEKEPKVLSLPLISVLPKKEMNAARELLEELDMMLYFIDENGEYKSREERAKRIKEELGGIQVAHGLEGMRFGGLTFAEREVSGRKTLDKVKLLENGVGVETIEASYVDGMPYKTRTYKRVL
jgi:hypothetical protein